MTKKQKGFTLVELMIVVAIIGILAAVAIPKFADMLEKSREGATKGNMSSIKSALSNYFADQQGVYPTGLNTASTSWQTTVIECYKAFLPTYIDPLPGVKVTAKNKVNGVNASKGPGSIASTQNSVLLRDWNGNNGALTAAPFTTAGVGWRYDPNTNGDFWVNSLQIDMAEKSYTIYGYE